MGEKIKKAFLSTASFCQGRLEAFLILLKNLFSVKSVCEVKGKQGVASSFGRAVRHSAVHQSGMLT